MKIAITTLGTRGDLQPFIALGVGLKQAGYEVLLISAKNDAEFVHGFGLDYHPLDVDIQKIMEEQEIQSMTKGDNPIKFFRSHMAGSKKLKTLMVATQEEVWKAVQGVDAIIYHPGMPNGYFFGRKLGIPSIMASPFPVTSTPDYPAILFYNGPRLGRLYNRLTHAIFEKIFWSLSKGAIKAFWKEKPNAPKIPSTPPTQLHVRSGMPVLYGYSPLIFAKPKDWPANIAVTGYWMLGAEPGWTPTSALSQFLESGEPPIYIGFGSIKDVTTFGETMQTVMQAIGKRRAIVALGWNSLPAGMAMPDNIHLLDNAPHAWLFPRMSAVVHHGGAGTTAAGLHAGKPTVIIAHNADQPAWGRRVFELGVGPKPILKKKLTADNLAAAITYALLPTVVAQAKAIGEELQKEDGVAEAVRVVTQFLGGI